MSFRNTTLACIIQMGDEIMVEPSSNPDLAGFNLLTKVMVKLVKVLPKGLGQEVQPGWVNTWMLTAEILFMFAWCAEGLGHKARMLMHDAKVIACSKVKCTGLLIERESHGRTGGREWEVLIDKELANLKASMDAMLGKTEEVEGLLDRKLMHPESKWCSWCYTEAHLAVVYPGICNPSEGSGPMALKPESNDMNCK
ncbi:hypothetical protein PAXRUDRAFT_129577 [Paxillus rubicundulus Ve08.2h10]|uniref:Uncharacterized protein n=1 Tax=Paxillus rubicundulus Ve08.2h10 TaxID=930991 RepID=A0A0D0EAQ1_9AGAM|nr:hypothetical protein PAXRUDRAFT_129577 [Paxillus rubicundulus Ve08.2h10]